MVCLKSRNEPGLALILLDPVPLLSVEDFSLYDINYRFLNRMIGGRKEMCMKIEI